MNYVINTNDARNTDGLEDFIHSFESYLKKQWNVTLDKT